MRTARPRLGGRPFACCPGVGLLVDGHAVGVFEGFEDSFGHGRVGVDGVHHDVQGGFQLDGSDAFVDHVGDVCAEHVDAEDFAVLLVADDLNEPVGVAGGDGLAEPAERELADGDVVSLFLGFAFAEADAGDFGAGVDAVGGGLVVHVLAFVFDDVACDDTAFVTGDVGELDAAGDVTDGEDVGHVGAEGVVDDFDASAMEFESDLFEVHVVGHGFASDPEEDDVDFDDFGFAAAGDVAGPAVGGFFALIEAGAGADVHALALEDFAEFIAEVFVHHGDDAGHHFDDGDLGAELVEDVGEFDTDGAGAEDEHPLGNVGGGDGVIGRPDSVFAAALETGDLEVDDSGAHGEDEVFGAQGFAAAVFFDADGVWVYELCEAFDVVDFVLFEEATDAAAEGGDGFVAVGGHFFEVEADFSFHFDAVLAGDFDIVESFGTGDHGLGGDASPVETGAAEKFLLDDGDVCTELGCADGGDVSAGAGANDNHICVEVFLGHGISEFLCLGDRGDLSNDAFNPHRQDRAGTDCGGLGLSWF